jgi:hypothetical protein
LKTRRSWKNQDRLFRELGKEKAPVIPCTWQEDEDGNWNTSCGEIFIIIDSTPDENHMKFCCYCGKPLKQAVFEEAAK